MATSLLLGWISIGFAGFTTPSYGFGYQRLSMVSLGWTPSSSRRDRRGGGTRTSLMMVSNMGWDNDNFLESLGKGPEAIEKANEEYNRLKEFGMQSSSSSSRTAGGPPTGGDGKNTGALSKDQIERIKEQNEKETGGGGEMFQKLMERAQQQQQSRPNMPPRQTPPPNTAVGPPPAPSSPPGDALPAGFENLSVEAQAALFRELLLNKQQRGSTPSADGVVAAPAKDNFIAKGTGPDGRRIGRNRDADAIVNSSDVYFAQLKLDSTVRNAARYNGDQEKADQVFADPRIRDIKLHVNPHIEEQRKRELEMLETAAEEMIVPYRIVESNTDKSDKGVSYKDRLRAKKQGLQQSPDAVTNKQFTSVAQTPLSTTAYTKTDASTQTTGWPLAESTTWSPPNPATMSAPVPTSMAPLPPPPLPLPRVEAASMFQKPIAASPPPPVSRPTMNTAEEQRQSIRTLMGLLLKHRGGPGFGSGRLQSDQEIERFDQLADTILAQLRSEAVVPQEQQGGMLFPPPPSPSPRESTPQMIPPQQQAYSPTAQSTPFVNTASSSKPASERMNAMIAAVEGALQLYKNSPPELQVLLVGTIQMTLVTAVSTCNQILDSGKENSSRTISSSTTYTDVEPETTRTFTTDRPVRTMPPPPARAINPIVVPPPEQSDKESTLQEISMPQYDGSDENSVFLESVYQKLQAVASSSGKLGLREGVSPADADSLADDLARMRVLLLEELDSGIPGSSSKGGSGASQKYKDMLAKAKAERKGYDDSKFE